MTKTVKTLSDLKLIRRTWRAEGLRVAMVPTMGALHEGHLKLVETALELADRVVVSVFVNPTQFGPKEDLSRYPRDPEGDTAKLRGAGAHVVWMPGVEDMYPRGFSTEISVGGAAPPLEGEFRPSHFSGVATVVTKLFGSAEPDVALFGEKDYQQLAVIRQTVRDLNLNVDVQSVPTVRGADGLALSSRNAYLSPEERSIAPALYRAISAVAAGADPEFFKESLIDAGFTKIDYLDVRDAETLAPYVAGSGRPGRVLVAAWLGKTRLIDNCALLAV